MNDCNALLSIICNAFEKKCGLSDRFRYVEHYDFTIAQEPESKKKRRIREGHLEQAKKRESESGLVINTFSQYMGKRIPIIEADVQKRFAFYAELFFASFEKQQTMPGFTKWVTKTGEEYKVASEELEEVRAH